MQNLGVNAEQDIIDVAVDEETAEAVIVDNTAILERAEVVKNIVKNIIKKQHELNLDTNGPEYLKGTTSEGKRIDWLLCLKAEIMEALNNFDWKHWKNVNMSYINTDAYIQEIIDAIHFAVSFHTHYTYISLYSRNIDVKTIINSSDASLVSEYFDKLNILEKDREDIIRFDEMTLMEQNIIVVKKACEIIDEIDSVGLITEVKEICDLVNNATNSKDMSNDGLVELLKHLVIHFTSPEDYLAKVFAVTYYSAELFNLTEKDIYKIYLAKNCLNRIRQDFGFKDRKYVRHWHGVDDTEFINICIKEGKLEEHEETIFDSDKFYEMLKHHYTTNVVGVTPVQPIEESSK